MHRRTLLGSLLGALLTGAPLDAQRRMRFVLPTGEAPEEPGQPDASRPRTLLAPTGTYSAASMRSALAADATLRARWQSAITSFHHASGDWAAVLAGSTTSRRASTVGIAAFLAAVRTSTDDLGITWGPSGSTTVTWEQYKDTCIARAVTWASTPNFGSEWEQLGVALVYDLLYDHISPGDRATMSSIIDTAAAYPYGVFNNGRWDDQDASKHVATVTCILASDNVSTWIGEALAESQDWATARYHSNQRTDGYEWKQGYPTNTGIFFCLWMLQKYLGLTEAATTGLMSYHAQHVLPYLFENTVPHPGRDIPFRTRMGMSEPLAEFYYETNIACYFLWAFQMLPGNVDLSATSDVRGHGSFAISDQATLANSESDFLGYLRTLWNHYSSLYQTISAWRDSQWQSSQAARPMLQALMSLPPWLILNTQLPTTAVSATAAGIPLVMRWWAGVTDLTSIRSGHTLKNSSDSMISYWHPKYAINNYEGSARHCGSWQVHRAGPLLTHRGSRGHGIVTRHWTKSANGTVSIVDPDLHPRYTYVQHESLDGGGQRSAGSNSDYWDSSAWRTPGSNVVAVHAATGFHGTIDGWYASSKAVVIRSNLKGAYNNDVYKMAAETAKLTAYTRDFVTIRRNGDGTTREKVFTYDRITLASLDFEPRYNLCPGPPQIDIDGTETAHAGWAPQGDTPYGVSNQAVQPTGKTSDVFSLTEVGDGRTPYRWFASGPTQWDYTGATRMIVDNRTEPSTDPNPSSKRHTVVGTGKACVTPLIGGNASSPTGFTFRKTGGLAATVYEGGSPSVLGDFCPQFGEWHGWAGPGDEGGDWEGTDGTGQRAYVGLYGVQVIPTTVAQDTRYLMATEVMDWNETPNTAAKLTSDAGSVVARVGPTAVVFSVSASGHSSGDVDIPSGVTLVVFANLPPNAARTLTPTGGLSITSTSGSPAGTSSNTGAASGVIEVVVSGSGNLAWS